VSDNGTHPPDPSPPEPDIESAYVGCVILAGISAGFDADAEARSAVDAAVSRIPASYLSDDRLRRIYGAACDDWRHNGGIDPILLRGQLAGQVPDEYLAALGDLVPSWAPIENYADRVHEAGARRDLSLRLASIAHRLDTGVATHDDALAMLATVATARHTARRITFRSIEEIRMLQSSTVEWLLDGLIGAGLVTVLAGQPKAGKSTWLFAVMAALERGDAICGLSTAQSTTVYLSEESAAGVVEKAVGFGVEQASYVTREGDDPSADFGAAVDAAIAEAERTGARLIVIDTLTHFGRLARDAEKDAGATGELLAHAIRAAARGYAVVVLHHVRKAEGDDGTALRGSSAIAGAADVIIELRRLESGDRGTERSLRVLSRFSDSPEELVIAMKGHRYVVAGESVDDAKFERVASALIEALEGAGVVVGRDAICGLIKGRDSLTWRTARRLVQTGRIGGDGNGRKGSPYRFWAAVPSYSEPVRHGTHEPVLDAVPNPVGSAQHQNLGGAGTTGRVDAVPGPGDGRPGPGDPSSCAVCDIATNGPRCPMCNGPTVLDPTT
jgi:hypothetical protein